MKAIIIEEDRFAEISEMMKHKADELAKSENAPFSVPTQVWERAVKEAHRSMHYHFVKWAQSHGASCVK